MERRNNVVKVQGIVDTRKRVRIFGKRYILKESARKRYWVIANVLGWLIAIGILGTLSYMVWSRI